MDTRRKFSRVFKLKAVKMVKSSIVGASVVLGSLADVRLLHTHTHQRRSAGKPVCGAR